MPSASSAEALLRMRKQKRADTRPELALRKVLHAQGLRYRVDVPLPLDAVRRRADLLFTRSRVAVFIDGCYWHACPVHGTSPKANAGWWSQKLETNVRRDRDTDQRLREIGWQVIRIWEHEDPTEAADRVVAAVR